MMKKILVTGATGFLGTHLCLRLLNEGHRVIGLDNFYTSSNVNLHLLERHSNFSFLEGDVIHPFPEIDVEEIYNLACPASPPQYQRDPLYTLKVSMLGALNALNCAHLNGAKILQASTSEVYGDPEISPQPEDYRGAVNPVGIRACYDEGKRVAETLFMDHRRQHGTSVRIMRIFNTYGPYMDLEDGRVVSNFIVQALRGEDITVYGDGRQTRSFCFVDDLIDGMVRLMAAPDDLCEPVNIGNPGEITVLRLAEIIRDMTGSASQIVYQPLPGDDPRQRCPDIARAKKLLGWAPRVSLDEGLNKTIPWFKMAMSL